MYTIILIVVLAIISLFFVSYLMSRYKKCPSDAILVKFGKVGSKGTTAKCIHGGGTFVIPIIQDFSFLSLTPIAIGIELEGALSSGNIRVNVPSTFTVGVSTKPEIMKNAAERLLHMKQQAIVDQARTIIFGQLRSVIAGMTIEQINVDREKFLDLVNTNVSVELNKIGLDLINVNIQDITDESGYIKAIGQQKAQEAINKANVEVAIEEKKGAIGTSTADKEKEVEVAKQKAESEIGKATANKTQTISVAQLKAEATEGENKAKANIADYDAELKVQESEAFKRSGEAEAEAHKAVYLKQKDTKVAMLSRDELAGEEVEKAKQVVQAEASKEKQIINAAGEAESIKLVAEAKAEAEKVVLEGKADGYKALVDAVGANPGVAVNLLLIEKIEHMMETQQSIFKNLDIDKITVWDSGNGTTANFMKQFGGAIPNLKDLFTSMGMELPEYLGRVKDVSDTDNVRHLPREGVE